MIQLLTKVWENKHTSGAAIAYMLAKGGAQLGAIWWPDRAAQFKSTADAIESLAVGYGLVMAGDAKKGGGSPTP